MNLWHVSTHETKLRNWFPVPTRPLHGQSIINMRSWLIIIFWLVVSTHLKNISQIGSFPQVGLKIKHIWNHHLVLMLEYKSNRFQEGLIKYIKISRIHLLQLFKKKGSKIPGGETGRCWNYLWVWHGERRFHVVWLGSTSQNTCKNVSK